MNISDEHKRFRMQNGNAVGMRRNRVRIVDAEFMF